MLRVRSPLGRVTQLPAALGLVPEPQRCPGRQRAHREAGSVAPFLAGKNAIGWQIRHESVGSTFVVSSLGQQAIKMKLPAHRTNALLSK